MYHFSLKSKENCPHWPSRQNNIAHLHIWITRETLLSRAQLANKICLGPWNVINGLPLQEGTFLFCNFRYRKLNRHERCSCAQGRGRGRGLSNWNSSSSPAVPIAVLFCWKWGPWTEKEMGKKNAMFCREIERVRGVSVPLMCLCDGEYIAEEKQAIALFQWPLVLSLVLHILFT